MSQPPNGQRAPVAAGDQRPGHHSGVGDPLGERRHPGAQPELTADVEEQNEPHQHHRGMQLDVDVLFAGAASARCPPGEDRREADSAASPAYGSVMSSVVARAAPVHSGPMMAPIAKNTLSRLTSRGTSSAVMVTSACVDATTRPSPTPMMMAAAMANGNE